MLARKVETTITADPLCLGSVPWLERHLRVVLLALMAVTAALYLGYVSMLGSEIAYPVDDAWIHQTFARNLWRYGGFVYNPGEVSSASTSPLWTVLLAGGYLLGLDHRLWSYLLGLVFLALTGLLVRALFRTLFPERATWAALAGLAVALEPHLGWAALSGMETMLFICLSLLLLQRALAGRFESGVQHVSRSTRLSQRFSPAVTGLLGGLLVVTRPEGLLLFFLILLTIVVLRSASDGTGAAGRAGREGAWHSPGGRLALTLLFFLAPLLPYAIFNYDVAGQPFPSTYYAKNTFYAQQMSLLDMARFLLLAGRELFSGPLLALMPGLIFAIGALAWRIWRAPSVRGAARSADLPAVGGPRIAGGGPRSEVTWLTWLPLLWCMVLVLAYMLRLPAVYHHGRYLMPVIPVLVIYGLWGTLRLCEGLSMRLLARVAPLLLASFWAALWVNGAVVYAWDVKFINDQNVTVARWLRDHAPPDAVVATHDIGAIGYVAGHPILDLAGLITPEVAPFVHQPDRLLSYLKSKRPAYLAMYPSWYPWLARDSLAREVYRVDEPYAIKQGLDNMVIYQLEWDEESAPR